MQKQSLLPVILCGGKGTRLWPLSRESFPKQFLEIKGNKNKSLLQQTQLRLKDLGEIKNSLLICNEEHRFIVAEQMREIDALIDLILLEPEGRNTAPAVALAAINAMQNGEDPILLILSADHYIGDNNKFLNAIREGIEVANSGRLVTFGILPNTPETGYGYIESYEALSEDCKVSEIRRFIEKPNKKMAEEYIRDKKFTWNSGVFMFKSSLILKELSKFEPKIIDYCKKSIENDLKDFNFKRLKKEYFLKCPNISIDVAVMERTKLGSVISLDAGWSDIGSWESLWDIEDKNEDQNFIDGNVLIKNSTSCYVKSDGRLIVAIGIEDLIIVETNDSILIAKKNQSQKIKNVVEELNNKNFQEGKNHKRIYRPWGNYISIANNKTWQVKKIEVKSGESLSLQMHHHRAEHWIVVKGTALVEIDGKEKILCENQSTYIPLGSKHRLSNPGKTKLIIIEVQSGSYLGEDDILRFDDKYGR